MAMTPSACGWNGCRYYGEDGDSYQVWWVYPASMTDEEILDDLARQGWETRRYYGGPGQPYGHEASVHRRGRRALVTQSGGRDV